MTERTSPAVESSPSLTATVQTIGTPPRLSSKLRDAAVTDLEVAFTGGTRGSPVDLTLVVTLSTGVSAISPAQLVDEAQASSISLATTTKNGYVFEHVQFPAPGAAAVRRFRITNVRANASIVLSGGSSGTRLSASVAIMSSTPIRLLQAEQIVVGVVEPNPAR
jgi:hypothetical protein